VQTQPRSRGRLRQIQSFFSNRSPIRCWPPPRPGSGHGCHQLRAELLKCRLGHLRRRALQDPAQVPAVVLNPGVVLVRRPAASRAFLGYRLIPAVPRHLTSVPRLCGAIDRSPLHFRATAELARAGGRRRCSAVPGYVQAAGAVRTVVVAIWTSRNGLWPGPGTRRGICSRTQACHRMARQAARLMSASSSSARRSAAIGSPC
jgi:hypothetical protein